MPERPCWGKVLCLPVPARSLGRLLWQVQLLQHPSPNGFQWSVSSLHLPMNSFPWHPQGWMVDFHQVPPAWHCSNFSAVREPQAAVFSPTRYGAGIGVAYSLGPKGQWLLPIIYYFYILGFCLLLISQSITASNPFIANNS